MGAVMRPGPATMRGLGWLAGVGPVSHPAWAAAMGWGPSATFGHAARLVDVGWAERQAMTRGDGSLIYATRAGVTVSGVRATVLAAPPAPTTWAHCEACGWVAAWLTARGRHMIGPRQLLAGVEWQGQVRWREHGSERARGHRPDLLAAITPAGPLMAVEVELATKSHARLHAVLALHARWVASGKARALIYVCGDRQLADRVRGTAEPLGLDETRRTLRIELLDVIRDAARDRQPVREGVR